MCQVARKDGVLFRLNPLRLRRISLALQIAIEGLLNY